MEIEQFLFVVFVWEIRTVGKLEDNTAIILKRTGYYTYQHLWQ
jgi:hypothetical protein